MTIATRMDWCANVENSVRSLREAGLQCGECE